MGRWAARLESWHALVRARAEALHVAGDRSTLPIMHTSCPSTTLDFRYLWKRHFMNNIERMLSLEHTNPGLCYFMEETSLLRANEGACAGLYTSLLRTESAPGKTRAHPFCHYLQVIGEIEASAYFFFF